MGSSVFHLVDLDRVIFDTAKFVAALTSEIHLTQPELGGMLSEQFEAAYRKEETFFLLRYLRQTRGDEWFEALVGAVVEKYGAEAFILPGARERFMNAETDGVTPSKGIITYGDDIDQRLKLRLIGLDRVPTYVTETPDKAKLLHTWQLPDGRFQLPAEFGGGIVSTLTLEDDKLRAFDDLPSGVLGVWITHYGDARARLEERGTQNVLIARDLNESTNLFREALTL